MSNTPTITDMGFDGVDGWAEILSEATDPERRRLQSHREEAIEAVREHGKEWLQEEIERKRKALESLRERYERAAWTVYDNADMDDPSDELDMKGLSPEEQAERIREAKEGAVWAGDEAPEPLVERQNEARQKRRRVRERLAALRVVRDEIAAEGLPGEIAVGEPSATELPSERWDDATLRDLATEYEDEFDALAKHADGQNKSRTELFQRAVRNVSDGPEEEVKDEAKRWYDNISKAWKRRFEMWPEDVASLENAVQRAVEKRDEWPQLDIDSTSSSTSEPLGTEGRDDP